MLQVSKAEKEKKEAAEAESVESDEMIKRQTEELEKSTIVPVSRIFYVLKEDIEKISDSKLNSDFTKIQKIAKEVKDFMEKFYLKYRSSDLNYFNVSRAIIVEFLKKTNLFTDIYGLDHQETELTVGS